VPRRNPFDLSYDSEEAIPGSAPSILHARKNPFDLSLEELNANGTNLYDNSNFGESVTSTHVTWSSEGMKASTLGGRMQPRGGDFLVSSHILSLRQWSGVQAIFKDSSAIRVNQS
jgi:hypothetical protein